MGNAKRQFLGGKREDPLPCALRSFHVVSPYLEGSREEGGGFRNGGLQRRFGTWVSRQHSGGRPILSPGSLGRSRTAPPH